MNDLIQTKKNDETSTWKIGERGWERHERHDERSNEVRSDEEEEDDAGTGLQGEGVHEHGPCTLEHRRWTQGGFHLGLL